jgi:hypothetical protein
MYELIEDFFLFSITVSLILSNLAEHCSFDLKLNAWDILKMVKFDIAFDHNGVFQAGSAVTGKLVMNLSKNTRINGL